jgi:diguanylate cyclase (GGDEF)-like protein
MDATLLVVDDDAMNRDALSRRLMRNGYAVLTAENGHDALAMVSGHRVDAVLLDVMMPGMSGIETLRRLRESRSLSDLPVIMVTANDRSEDVVEALDLGANDYVTKPIDFPVALARIRAQVTARRADPLTGLPNRVQFLDHVERLLSKRRTRPAPEFAVFFLDIDRFKLINDSMGHSAGDELLTALVRRLEACLRDGEARGGPAGADALARLGGDEFTIAVDGIRDVANARLLAERLLASIEAPFSLQGREVFASVSLGVVLSDARYQRAEDMVRDADTAMYRAKTLGKARYEVFDSSMLAVVEERLQLEADLRHALDRQQLRVYYQPIVSLADGALCGFEALLRWHHPDRGVIAPDEFIPLAEQTGLILPIGYWVLQEACRQTRAWDEEFPAHRGLSISVNLSARQCIQPDIVRDVAQVLADTRLEASRLKLEITEGAVLENSADVVGIFTRLRDLGVELSLDDFGMGYSTLSYLQRFPFQTIKIDRSFVTGMQESGKNEIIRAIVQLAGAMAMSVTAEGIETAEQVAGLRALACDYGQGYYFYRPVTAEAARTILHSSRQGSRRPV